MNNILEPLSEEEYEEFDALILEYANEDDLCICDIVGLDAFLTALLCSPTLIPSNQWIARIWNFHKPHWQNDEDFERYMNLLFRYYNSLNYCLQAGREFYAAEFEYRPKLDGTYTTIYGDWTLYFLEGLEFVGIQSLPADIQPNLDLIRKYNDDAQDINILNSMSNADFEQKANEIEDAVFNIFKYMYHNVYLPSLEQEPYVRKGRKIGVNEPCPCGSGKKYKKCCGRAH